MQPCSPFYRQCRNNPEVKFAYLHLETISLSRKEVEKKVAYSRRGEPDTGCARHGVLLPNAFKRSEGGK